MPLAQPGRSGTAWRNPPKSPSTGRRATLQLWEAGFYALLAAAIALAIALLFFPLFTFAVIVTSGAAVSAGIAWLLFARQSGRSVFVRLLIVSCAAAILFVMSPLPMWSIMRPALLALDPGLDHVFRREMLGAAVAMIGAVITAPLAFVASFAGTALYWLLRSLVVCAWRDE